MFQNFIEKTTTLQSDMSIEYQGISQGLIFSNTGMRGKKYFLITLKSVLQALKDIKNNLSKFESHTRYVEGDWRDLFPKYLTDPTTIAMSTVQTLPLFNLLSKIIHLSNDIAVSDFDDKKILLSETALDVTIKYLEAQIPTTPPAIKRVGAIQGENIIFYGAPGTGKSYTVDAQLHGNLFRRTVFHSETQYADFVGSLKPVIETVSEGAGTREFITYKFIPGPFTEAYIDALNNPAQHVILVIEEINRAQAAAVFGELFQLLDRDENGNGQYAVDATDPMLSNYIKNNVANETASIPLKMPANLSLLATMNSSDQAVMPMDTAFKRRWKFCYIKLDFSVCAEGNIPISNGVETFPISWKKFALVLNNEFAKINIPEDRHFGPFFIQNHELSDVKSATATLTGKLLLYIWDDMLRHRNRSDIFHENIFTFGQLINRYESKEIIFNSEVQSQLMSEANNMSRGEQTE